MRKFVGNRKNNGNKPFTDEGEDSIRRLPEPVEGGAGQVQGLSEAPGFQCV